MALLIQELTDQRVALVKEIRTFEEKNPKLDAEQKVQLDKMYSDQEELGQKIERMHKLETVEKSMKSPSEEPIPHNAGAGAGNKREQETREAELRLFRSYLSGGMVALQNNPEFRALNAGLVTEGGAFIAPQEFSTDLLKVVDDMLIMDEGLCTVYTVNKAGSLGFPSWESDPADADWTTELAVGSTDTAMGTGTRELKPVPIAKLVKVSRTLLAKSALPVENLIRDRLAYKFAVTKEKAYLTGNGASQPLGIFTASDKGIPTSRDVSTDMLETEPTADALLECFFSLKEFYQNNATWVMHRLFKKKIRKLKDGEGRYLWEPSLIAGSPDTILNRPVRQSEFAPSTFTSGQYAAVVGYFKNYLIANDVGTLSLQKLVELFATTNQDGFIGRMETDGMPVLAEAWARLKFA